MRYFTLQFKLKWLILAAILILTACTEVLVKDDTHYPTTGTSHCAGTQWTDDSSLSVLPIPVVAFFVPHTDVHEIKADDYIKRCSDTTKLINRKVEADRAACFPAALTRIITLGIWQWCPVRISWEADVRS